MPSFLVSKKVVGFTHLINQSARSGKQKALQIAYLQGFCH
jgi:hypothetical protein